MVGAAALTSGATQTVSTTVIVFELTGQLNHMVAVLLATVLAYSVAGQFSISVYDVLLQVKGLPYLPRAHGRALYHKTAQDLMHRDIRFLTLHDSTFADAVHLVGAHLCTARTLVSSLPARPNVPDCVCVPSPCLWICVAPPTSSNKSRCRGAMANRCLSFLSSTAPIPWCLWYVP